MITVRPDPRYEQPGKPTYLVAQDGNEVGWARHTVNEEGHRQWETEPDVGTYDSREGAAHALLDQAGTPIKEAPGT